MKQKSLNLCGFQRCSSCKNIPPHSLVDPPLVHSSLVTWSILPWSTRPWLNLFGPIKRLPGPLVPGYLVDPPLVTWFTRPWVFTSEFERDPGTSHHPKRTTLDRIDSLVPGSWCVVFCAISRLPGARSLFPGARFLVRSLVTFIV